MTPELVTAVALFGLLAVLTVHNWRIQDLRRTLDQREDLIERVGRLEEASKCSLAWSNAAEDEFDRINGRIEGVSKLGAYRSAARVQSADSKEKT